MTRIQRLKAEARESATWRGHDMIRFTVLSEYRVEAVCRDCGAYVQVDANPAANGIDIGGTAVAINCGD
ncbi:hypothetical protein LCGC14_1432690 [marine sediment metagenome]|uniref:Uncharacterized protein n=1 Tax=marine sediment metagenome TaxID=412755 RepID=A0A0F9JN35_9ZZZZ